VIIMPLTGHTERTRQSAGIQINEHLDIQARIWRIERIGWLAMTATLLAAGAGLFGHGLMSRAKIIVAEPVEAAAGMVLDYEQWGRAHRESQFLLSRPSEPSNGTFSLWLSNDYLSDAELVRITPEPVTQELASNGVRYHFRIEHGPRYVIFRFKPERSGRLSGSIRLNDGPPATFEQWLFP
jgi:hypothetical protein